MGCNSCRKKKENLRLIKDCTLIFLSITVFLIIFLQFNNGGAVLVFFMMLVELRIFRTMGYFGGIKKKE